MELRAFGSRPPTEATLVRSPDEKETGTYDEARAAKKKNRETFDVIFIAESDLVVRRRWSVCEGRYNVDNPGRVYLTETNAVEWTS